MDGRTISISALSEAANAVIPSIGCAIADDGSRFSGVFATFQDHYFLVTAEHCIAGIENWATLRILPYHWSGTIPQAVTRGRFWSTSPDDSKYRKDTRFDLGLIWLDRAFASQLEATWINVDRMTSSMLGEGTLVVVCGYPTKSRDAKLTTPEELADERFICVSSASLEMPALLVLPPKPWVDVFVRYDPEDLLNLDDESGSEPIALRGLSGAGMFAITVAGVRAPGEIPLVGIQHGAWGHHKMIRGTRAEYVANLMRNFSLEHDHPSGSPSVTRS